jgi:hypothetical protein
LITRWASMAGIARRSRATQRARWPCPPLDLQGVPRPPAALRDHHQATAAHAQPAIRRRSARRPPLLTARTRRRGEGHGSACRRFGRPR